MRKLLILLKIIKYPANLKINNREKLQTSDFHENDKLYRGFSIDDYDSDKKSIESARIKFPDFSCNWALFSEPKHIKYRQNGKNTDGCYSFTVKDARYNKIATPVHEPIHDKWHQNYSHVEIRVLRENEESLCEPPKKRKLNSKSKKLEYRTNLVNKLCIEFKPSK